MQFRCVSHFLYVPLQPQKWLLRWQIANNTLKKNGLYSRRENRLILVLRVFVGFERQDDTKKETDIIHIIIKILN